MASSIDGKYKLEISINNKPLNSFILEEFIIYENMIQILPTMDLTFISNSDLLEATPLLDGSQVDIDLTIFGLGKGSQDENIRMEFLLFKYQATELSEGIKYTLNCIYSAPDFLDARIESVNGSSFEVFSLMANRSRLNLVADPSIDKQVWIRNGIKGNLWLNHVNNHSWSSETSAFVYAVSRHRDLLRYNITERASRNPAWTFIPERETNNLSIDKNAMIYKYPHFKSNAGLLNSFFGYGRELSSFDIQTSEHTKHKPTTFIKRTNFMNLNEKRETPQRYEFQGFNNSLNVHPNYFLAYAQNQRFKSFYSVNVEIITDYPKNIKILDRVNLLLNNEAAQSVRNTYAGHYFIDKITTVIDPTTAIRRVSLVREGFNSESSASFNAK
jgi:hypothetical protein